MHKKFITDGVVLAKRGVGEANASAAILTRELGLIRAKATSARVNASRLRYGLEPLTVARYTFVRGKVEWKLTGVERVQNLFSSLMPLPPASLKVRRASAGRISKLLVRLVQGEEPTEALYRVVAEGFASLASAKSEQDAEAIECVLVLRVLSILGYLPARPELAPFVGESVFSLQLAAAAAQAKTQLIKAINESLSATGL